MAKKENLTGHKFGYLSVIGEANNRNGNVCWAVRCKCGVEKEVMALNLRNGLQSCGCKMSEGNATKHGATKTPEYRTWTVMKSRCYNKNNPFYRNYGERGIGVQESWLGADGFETFLKDVGAKPSPKYSLDRIDVNKGYSTDNVRWATNKEQSRNKRNNLMLEHEGKTQCLSAWAEEKGMNASKIQQRLTRGWTVEKALSNG